MLDAAAAPRPVRADRNALRMPDRSVLGNDITIRGSEAVARTPCSATDEAVFCAQCWS
jgi:hypothetical protein